MTSRSKDIIFNKIEKCIPKVWCVKTCCYFVLLQNQWFQFKSSMVPVYLLTEKYLVSF